MTETELCPKCKDFREYRIKRYMRKGVRGGIKFEYESFSAFCTKCRTTIHVPWIDDMNDDSFEKAFTLAIGKEKNK